MIILILEICTGPFDLMLDGVKYHTESDTKSLYELEKIFFQRLTLAFQMIAICPIAIWNVNLRAALLTYIVQKVQPYPTEITATLTGFDKYCPKYKVLVFGHNLYLRCSFHSQQYLYSQRCSMEETETLMYKFSAN